MRHPGKLLKIATGGAQEDGRAAARDRERQINIFTPARPIPPHDRSKPGEFVWSELRTTDHEACDQELGGMFTQSKDMPMPPAGLYYVEVVGLEAAIERAKSKGARLMHGPMGARERRAPPPPLRQAPNNGETLREQSSTGGMPWRTVCARQSDEVPKPIDRGRHRTLSGSSPSWSATVSLRRREEDWMLHLHYWPTPNGKKVTIFLEEARLEYRIVPCNIGRGDQFEKSFLALNPNHRMPVLVDDEPAGGGGPISVFESGAILLYLAEKSGLFWAQHLRGRYEITQWGDRNRLSVLSEGRVGEEQREQT
jgi:hypothetical protein